MKIKDDRWAKQFGDFAEGFVMYNLGQLKNMSVALIDHVGADILATDREDKEKRYAVSVKGRNFPAEESKSFNFSTGNIEKLTETAQTFGMIPAVAFVFVDEQEGSKKIRLFTTTLEKLEEMCNDENIQFVNHSQHGINFLYTESKRVQHLSSIKACGNIDYTELEFNVLKHDSSPF